MVASPRPAQLQSWFRSLAKPRNRIIIATVLVPLLLLAFAAWRDRVQLEESAAERATRSVTALAEHAQRVLDAQHSALLRVAENIGNQSNARLRASRPFHEWLRRIADQSEYIVAISVIGRDGRAVASSLDFPTPPINASDRSYYRAFAANPRASFYISEPMIGRPTGELVFQLAHRRTGPDGRFEGVILASVRPDALAAFYREVASEGDAVTLARNDGTVLVREPPTTTGLQQLPAVSGLMRSIAANPNGGIYRTTSHLDHVDRLHAYRKVSRWPLYVSYGRSMAAVAEQWLRDLLLYGSAVVFASLLLLGVGLVAIQRARAEEAALVRAHEADALRASEAALREQQIKLQRMNEMLEQRVAERTRELADQEALFRGIFNSSFQFAVLLYPDGRIAELNQAALNFSGLSRSHAIGGKFWNAAVFQPSEALRSEVREAIERAAAGETTRREIEVTGKEGHQLSIDFSIKPLHDEQGNIAWLVSEGRDITELKAAQAQLHEAQKLETVGQLTGGVAHDFNNLLTPIVGSLDLLQRRLQGDERAQRQASAALQAAERARVLVQRLLAFSRRQHLEARPVDLAALVGGMSDLIRRSIGPQIEVAFEVPAGLPSARVDPNQLELAILNLAVNARDAMPNGGRLAVAAAEKRIEHEQALRLPRGHYLCLSVTDTGIGMNAETLRHAVEPFFTTKGVGRGTGLGLSMVHGLAAQSGGLLRLVSSPGNGTRAELWLPVSQQAATSDASDADAPLRAVRSATILLVDDEELVRVGTAEMLRDLGYSVVEAASAAHALELLRRGLQADLVISDYAMPSMSGIELARDIKLRWPSMPIMLITGFSSLSDQEAAGLPRLAKPFRQAELAASVAALLDGTVHQLPLPRGHSSRN